MLTTLKTPEERLNGESPKEPILVRTLETSLPNGQRRYTLTIIGTNADLMKEIFRSVQSYSILRSIKVLVEHKDF